MFAMVSRTESYVAIGCVSLGGIVSALLASKGSHFLANFAFYWLPQLGVLAFVCLCKPRLAVIAGVATVLAVYLAAFGTWAFTRNSPESMAWLGYLFSLPGALLAAVGAAIMLRARLHIHPLAAGAMAAGVVFAGIAINQTVVCSTVIYCLGK